MYELHEQGAHILYVFKNYLYSVKTKVPRVSRKALITSEYKTVQTIYLAWCFKKNIPLK